MVYKSSVPQPGNIHQPLDSLSARTYLSSALSQFLGLTGTAIPTDILKIEHGLASAPKVDATSTTQVAKTTRHDSVWIRVPREDAPAVVAAVSSWIGGGNNSTGSAGVAWRVCAKGNFLSALTAGSGADLFVP
jgi:ribonuclease P/MRP protein subunit POP8